MPPNVLSFVCCQKSTLFVACFAVFYVVYLIVGASMFSLIESKAENEMVKQYIKDKEAFLATTKVDAQLLDEFIMKTLSVTARGVTIKMNETESNWDFMKSFFFSTTLITTVGYGQVSPATNLGKCMCILYALFGIPFTIILFASIIERLFFLTYKPLKDLSYRYGYTNESNLRLLMFFIVLSIIVIFFFLIPTIIFHKIEKQWSYLDCLYYCFISLSTIGLGDYVPGNEMQGFIAKIYKLSTSGYIIIGVIFMMFLLTVTASVPYFKLGKYYHLEFEPEENETRGLIRNSVGSVPHFIRKADGEPVESRNP